MKVLIVAATPYFSNRGCHIRIFLGAKYLQKKGVDILLCTYHLGENVGDFPIKTIGDTAWYKKTSPGFAWGKIWLDTKLLFLCIKQIIRFKPDAIHAHLFEGLAIGYLAKLLTGRFRLPIVMDSQGDLEAEFNAYNKNDKLAKRIFVSLARKVVRLADYIVVSSENALPCFEKITKSKKKITIVRDGMGIEFLKEERELYSEKNAKDEIKQLKGWIGDKKLLIYSGGMEDSKGVGELIKQFIVDREKLSNWKLLLYGVGKDRNKYKNFTIEEGAQEQITFARETNFFVLPNFLKLADVAIEPKKSSTESSGKLLNYMAVGLPVICFKSKFNKKRLGKKGFYLKKIEQLTRFLEQGFPSEVAYNLKKECERDEVDKLFGIFRELIESRR